MSGGAPERGFAQLQLELAQVEGTSGHIGSDPWLLEPHLHHVLENVLDNAVENVVSAVENALENVVECVLETVL